MTLTSLDSRKRPRACEEDDNSELGSQPLLKRINNLHIRSNIASQTQVTAPTVNNGQSDQGQLRVVLPNGRSTDSEKESVNEDDRSLSCYAPELNANQNPFYYHINNLLFQAHLQRLSRINNSD